MTFISKIFNNWYYPGSARTNLYPQHATDYPGRIRYSLELVPPKNQTILVVGDSYGWYAHYALKAGAKMVCSFDIAQPSPYIQKLLAKYNNFRHLTTSALEYEDKKKFTLAIFLEVIEHLPINTETTALKHIYNSLKSGGLLLLSTPINSILSYVSDPAIVVGHRHYSVDHLTSLLTKSGFKQIQFTRGGYLAAAVDSLSMYFTKWILRRVYKSPLTSMLDKEYPHSQGTTLFAVCRK